MKANYHTHHELCGHAIGNCEEYAVEAIKHNFQELGYSDHAPNPKINDFGVRMRQKDFLGYIEEIETVKKKYKDVLTIKKGIEVEYFYDHEDYYDDLKSHLDYMILGQHYISFTRSIDNIQSSFALSTDREIELYAEFVCEGLKTKRFDILAHPDLYMCGYKDWNQKAIKVAHKILKCAEETDTIIEFNANGYRRGIRKTPQGNLPPYPRLEFWELAKQYKVRTILSSDCHTPEHLNDTTIKEVEEVYKSLGLEIVKIL